MGVALREQRSAGAGRYKVRLGTGTEDWAFNERYREDGDCDLWVSDLPQHGPPRAYAVYP